MNPNFTLYFNPLTVNSIKVLLLCNAMNIKPDRKLIQLHKGEQFSPDYLQLNPKGKVPLIVDGEFVLSESNAILQYLAHKYDSSLWPREIEKQGSVLQWLFWQSSIWSDAVGLFSHRRVVLPHWGLEGSQNFSQEHISRFLEVMGHFNSALKDRRVLVGDDFTIADISIGSFLIFAEEAQMPLEDFVNVRQWLDNLRDTPWWQKTQQSLREIIKG